MPVVEIQPLRVTVVVVVTGDTSCPRVVESCAAHVGGLAQAVPKVTMPVLFAAPVPTLTMNEQSDDPVAKESPLVLK